MESLSYLASLVVNRMEGPYVKLGLDVGGYRNKREDDLSALARRIADRVIRTGCYYEMEPMNPYERHIIHTAIAEIDGVRSESKGDGPARHVVLYSTDPDACNLPDRDNARNQRGGRRDGGRGPRRDNRGGRSPRGPREGGRGPARDSAPRVWQPKAPVRSDNMSFEDMMARYKTRSEEKIADLKRVTENHRGGYSRRRG